ncbi:MAG: phosphoglycerate kinase [Vampirovibrionia bacterium]
MLTNLVKSSVAFQGKVTDLTTRETKTTTPAQNDTVLGQLGGALQNGTRAKVIPGEYNKGLDSFTMLIDDNIKLQKDGDKLTVTMPKNEVEIKRSGDTFAVVAKEGVKGDLEYKLDLNKDGSAPIVERFLTALKGCVADMKQVTDTVNDLKNLRDKKVFVRVDFNVPLDKDAQVTNDNRIKQALPTIKHLIDKGAKVIIASHLGKPKGQVVDKLKMDPVADKLRELLHQDSLYSNVNVTKLDDCVGPKVNLAVNTMESGSIVVLENVRFHPEEEKNNEQYAMQLADLADIYVNDAI